jgi:hypothetical protein
MKTCGKCGNGYETGGANGNEWTGTEWLRMSICGECWHGVGFTQKPRRPRQRRQQYAYGDYGQMVAFMGNPGGRKS